MRYLACALLAVLCSCSNSPDEQEVLVVETNTLCPITGKAVDEEAMIDVSGRAVYFCCDKCVAKGVEDPEGMLAIAYPE